MATGVHPIRAPELPLGAHYASGWPRLALGVLDRLREAVLVLAPGARLLGANRAGSELLREGDGLVLSASSVIASTPEVTRALKRGIAHAIRGSAAYVEVPRPGRAPLSLLVEPHGSSDAAVVFASDPEQSRSSRLAAVAARYRFTPTESEVARLLTAGADLERIAEALQISVNTVRGHLKQVFLKTRTHRQAELVSKLLSET